MLSGAGYLAAPVVRFRPCKLMMWLQKSGSVRTRTQRAQITPHLSGSNNNEIKCRNPTSETGVAASSDGWRHWELRRQRIVSRGCQSNLAAGGPGGKVSDSSVKQEVGRKKREDRLEFGRP